jgi:hypothetical protein
VTIFDEAQKDLRGVMFGRNLIRYPSLAFRYLSGGAILNGSVIAAVFEKFDRLALILACWPSIM